MTSDPPRLPRLIGIANRFTLPERADTIVRAVADGGLPWVHLRDHLVDDATFDLAAASLVKRLRDISPEVKISVNTRLDTAIRLGCHYHRARFGPHTSDARTLIGEGLVIGESTHDAHEIAQAEEDGVDYVFFSPVFETASKPNSGGVGLRVLAEVCRATHLPVYALGGVRPDRVAACLEAGAYGVAVLSAIMDVEAPGEGVRRFLAEFERLKV
jgi:thiamine-phosphate pyrophosphorylase